MNNLKPSGNQTPMKGEQFEGFKKLVDALPTTVILMNAEGLVLHMNPMAVWLMQTAIGDLTGKKMPVCEEGETTLVWRIPTSKETIQFVFTVVPVTLDGMDTQVLVTNASGYQHSFSRSSEAIFSRMFDQANEGIVICDHDMVFVEWNKGMELLTGFSAEEVIGKSLDLFLNEISPNLNDPLLRQDILNGHTPDALENLIKSGGSIELEQKIKHRNGSIRLAHYRMFPVFVESKVYIGAMVQDITEYRKAETELRASETRFRTLVVAMGEGALILDLDMNIIFSNPTADSMFGAGAQYLKGRNVRDFVDPEALPVLQEQVKRVGAGRSARYELEVADFRGNPHTLLVTSTPWRGPDIEILGSIIVFGDITTKKLEEERLRFSSTRDELTELYNRNFFEEEKMRLKASRRYPVSVVMADMDTLKQVNDTLGHRAGDGLLKELAKIAGRVFRREDMIARIGGDEFAIFLPETQRDTAREAVERLRDAIREYNAQNPDLPMSVSIGTATAPTADELDEAIHRSDYRMFREKRQKKAASSANGS